MLKYIVQFIASQGLRGHLTPHSFVHSKQVRPFSNKAYFYLTQLNYKRRNGTIMKKEEN